LRDTFERLLSEGFTRLRHRRKAMTAIAFSFIVVVSIFVGYETLQSARKRQANENLAAARAAYQAGKFELSKTYLDRVSTLDPRNAEAHLLLAQIHEAHGDLKRAEQEYRKAISLGIDSLDVRYNLAVLLAAQGKDTEALEIAIDIAEKSNSYYPARLLLARLYRKAGKKNELETTIEVLLSSKYVPDEVKMKIQEEFR
jgi:Tfp pilus assembly protein PilF